MPANISILKPITVHLCSLTLAFIIGSVIYTIFVDGFWIIFKPKSSSLICVLQIVLA